MTICPGSGDFVSEDDIDLDEDERVGFCIECEHEQPVENEVAHGGYLVEHTTDGSAIVSDPLNVEGGMAR